VPQRRGQVGAGVAAAATQPRYEQCSDGTGPPPGAGRAPCPAPAGGWERGPDCPLAEGAYAWLEDTWDDTFSPQVMHRIITAVASREAALWDEHSGSRHVPQRLRDALRAEGLGVLEQRRPQQVPLREEAVVVPPSPVGGGGRDQQQPGEGQPHTQPQPDAAPADAAPASGVRVPASAQGAAPGQPGPVHTGRRNPPRTARGRPVSYRQPSHTQRHQHQPARRQRRAGQQP
jgi:hypothetical protein